MIFFLTLSISNRTHSQVPSCLNSVGLAVFYPGPQGDLSHFKTHHRSWYQHDFCIFFISCKDLPLPMSCRNWWLLKIMTSKQHVYRWCERVLFGFMNEGMFDAISQLHYHCWTLPMGSVDPKLSKSLVLWLRSLVSRAITAKVPTCARWEAGHAFDSRS